MGEVQGAVEPPPSYWSAKLGAMQLASEFMLTNLRERKISGHPQRKLSSALMQLPLPKKLGPSC